MRSLGAVLLLVLSSCGDLEGADSAARTTARVLVEPGVVRRVGWAAADADDEAAIEAALAQVRRRIEAFDLGIPVSADVPSRILEVGPMSTLTRPTAALVSSYVEGMGGVEFLPVADPLDVRGLDDFEDERARLAAWVAANPGRPLVGFNAVPRDEGGPHPALLWVPEAVLEEEGALPELERALPFLLIDRPGRAIALRDALHVYISPSFAASPTATPPDKTTATVWLEDAHDDAAGSLHSAFTGRRFGIVCGNAAYLSGPSDGSGTFSVECEPGTERDVATAIDACLGPLSLE